MKGPLTRETVRRGRNPTHGSGWIVHTQPTNGRTGFSVSSPSFSSRSEEKEGDDKERRPVCLVG